MRLRGPLAGRPRDGTIIETHVARAIHVADAERNPRGCRGSAVEMDRRSHCVGFARTAVFRPGRVWTKSGSMKAREPRGRCTSSRPPSLLQKRSCGRAAGRRWRCDRLGGEASIPRAPVATKSVFPRGQCPGVITRISIVSAEDDHAIMRRVVNRRMGQAGRGRRATRREA